MIGLTAQRSLLASVALIAALAALAMTVGAPTAWSASYTRCSLSESEQNPTSGKPTYNLELKKRKTTCATAKKS